MSGIGHNGGPTMEPGTSWRRHCWGKARADLLPTLPLEVVRLRVARAERLGLDYRTYATVRATSGHDIVAFLFSSNALRLFAPAPALPADRAGRLAALRDCGRLALVSRPLVPEAVAPLAPGHWDEALPAPAPFASWGEARRALRGALQARRLPPAGVLMVGDTWAERDWSGAAALAGYLEAERYFPAAGVAAG